MNEQNFRINDPVYEFVTNDTLQCKDCAFLMDGNTIECEKYLKKPGYVLYGSKPCPQYCKRSVK